VTMSNVDYESGELESTWAAPGAVDVSGLRMVYRDRNGAEVTALDGVDLHVPGGQFWVLLGPSGCGKTTLLRCLAGLERPRAGTISIDGAIAVDDGQVRLSAQERPVGMVFQSYALWPHMTVAQNVAYPLTVVPRRRRLGRNEIEARVAQVTDAMQIGHLRDRNIGQLSGGQQQRVALARAVVAGNEVVLFDEPLSNIDAKVREQLRIELKTMQREFGFTAIYVTHDQAEAMDLADQIVVLDHGEIVQIGSPREIYYRPRTCHVAEFIGTSNMFTGVIEWAADESLVATTDAGAFPVHAGRCGDSVAVASRAHDWWLAPASSEREGGMPGRIVAASLLGHYCDYIVEVGSLRVHVWADDLPWADAGREVVVGCDRAKAQVFPV
jgi:iron(III) transport system ATP-binding protein